VEALLGSVFAGAKETELLDLLYDTLVLEDVAEKRVSHLWPFPLQRSFLLNESYLAMLARCSLNT
jgi:hypothetical protein